MKDIRIGLELIEALYWNSAKYRKKLDLLVEKFLDDEHCPSVVKAFNIYDFDSLGNKKMFKLKSK